MKARTQYITNRSDVKKEVTKEFQYQEQQLAENFTYQTVANILYILEKQFGFGKKRLNTVFDAIDSLNTLQNQGVLGETFDNLDLIEYFNTKYDIDVTKRIKVCYKQEVATMLEMFKNVNEVTGLSIKAVTVLYLLKRKTLKGVKETESTEKLEHISEMIENIS